MTNIRGIIIGITVLFSACSNEPELILHTSNGFSVFPNPAIDRAYAYINNKSSVPYKLEVFDAKGKRILSQVVDPGFNSQYPILLDGRPQGTYHVTLTTEKSVLIKEFIKIKP
jgi:hypothetical protein